MSRGLSGSGVGLSGCWHRVLFGFSGSSLRVRPFLRAGAWSRANMFGFLAALSGCGCAGCNKHDKLFGFWLRRPPGWLRRVGVSPGSRAEHKNNCSGFGVSGLESASCCPGPVDFTWSVAAEDSRAHEQLFAFLASGQVSCNTNISGCPLHSQRQMFDTGKCIFCLIM